MTAARARHRHAVRHDRRRVAGVALVLVLWMLALLSVIAGSMVYSSRTSLLVAGNLQAQANIEAIADAGVHKAIHELSRSTADPQRWKGDGVEHAWEFAGARLRIRIVDESARVDLNTAPPELLKGLFRSVGADDARAAALADAVVDWRDGDDLRGLHGAEKADYAAAGKSYGPANGPYESVDELALLLGVDEPLFRRLQPLVTVHSMRPGINTAVASRDVLLALPGSSGEQVDFFLGQRQALLNQGLPAPPFPGAQDFVTGPVDTVSSIQVAVQFGDNERFFREALVRLTSDSRRPLMIFAWRSRAIDALPSASDPASAR